MKLNNVSAKFGNNVLLWEEDIELLKNTDDQFIDHYIQDKYNLSYTTLSVLQAYIKKDYLIKYTSKGKIKFLMLNPKSLIQVVPNSVF